MATKSDADGQAFGTDRPDKPCPSKPSFIPRLGRILGMACFIYLNIRILLFLKASYSLPVAQDGKPYAQLTSAFDWDKLSTSPRLDYHACYNDFQCARLELPLDYWNGTTNKTISLAVMRLPAKVAVTDPRYGGAVLVNPGGPGGSGIALLTEAGPQLQAVIDASSTLEETGSYFDVISFDPRGVGLSQPSVQCFKDAATLSSWLLRFAEEGTLTSSDAALGRQWSMVHALGGSCSDVDQHSIQRYLTTASVAHDMLGIVEAHGWWRGKEAAKQLETNRRSYRTASPDVLPHLQYKPGQEKLQYWGFSYGTYLGATFAALYPDRADRLVLDGVVDAKDYTVNDWYDNLLDSEKDMDSFYYHCARVGPSGCALATHKSTAADVEKRVKDIISSTYHNTLPVVGPTAEVISWTDVRALIFGALYTPVSSFAFVASILADVERGDGTSFVPLLRGSHHMDCPRDGKESPLNDPFVASAILCGDGDSQLHQNKTSFALYMKSLQALSPTIGDFWAAIKLSCIGYTLRPNYRFTGPWQGNTSHPILWIGNTADPVTPLALAKKMAKGYPSSVVLTQDSPGHCSVAAFSSCTVAYIRQYFQTGIMPPHGVVCPVDVLPFGLGPNDVAASDEVQVRIDRHVDVARAFHAAGGGLARSSLMGRVHRTTF